MSLPALDPRYGRPMPVQAPSESAAYRDPTKSPLYAAFSQQDCGMTRSSVSNKNRTSSRNLNEKVVILE